ncbi:MAG: esterase/lipase family protein [Dysgonomonas sp.]
MSDNRLKYPIVLVHGIAAKDSKLFWGRIPEKLKSTGLDIYLGNTDSWGGVESNALSLKSRIDSILEECGAEKVNLIAHSKGGIDSRFLISTLGYAPKIASLTTISTPHLGSEIVDYIFDKKYIHSPLAGKIIYALAKLYGDKSPDPHRMLEDLTTNNMIRFNQRNEDAKSVYYSSYYTLMKHKFDDFSHILTYNFLSKEVGLSDGVVSMRSSVWGESHTLIDGETGGISHSEIIDIKRKKISGIEIPDEYLKIVNRLMSVGL